MQNEVNSPFEVISARQLYYSKPDQILIRALNQAIVPQYGGNNATLVVASSSFYAVEALKRLAGTLILTGTGSFDPKLFCEYMNVWSLGKLIPNDVDNLQDEFSGIIWAEPKQESFGIVLDRVTRASRRGCDLSILLSPIFPNPFASTEIPQKSKDRPPNPRRLAQFLEKHGWKVGNVISYSGPSVRFWVFLAEKFLRHNYFYWSDRCFQMQRTKMREPGWLWFLSRWVLIRSRLV